MNVAHTRVSVFVHLNQLRKQIIDPHSFGCHCRHNRNPNHFAQRFMVESHPFFIQLVIHVQRYHHFNVHINELSGEEHIALQVRSIQYIDDDIRAFLLNMRSHVQFFGRIFGD